MKKKLETAKFFERIQFIFHKIILGVIGWLVISWLMKYQQNFISDNANKLSNFILSFAPFIIYIWFFFTSNKKNKWNIFDKNENVIAIVITVLTILILALTIGSAKIFL